jgi:hypothetical protein
VTKIFSSARSLTLGPAGQFPGPRLQDRTAAQSQTGQIFLHDGVGVHFCIHRRADEHRCGRGKQRRGQQVIGDPRRHLADQVGRRRCDDHEFGKRGQGNMVHLKTSGQVEKVRGNTIPGEALEGQRGDEFAGMVGHHHPDLGPAPDQFPDQFGGLIGGNAAGDAQNDFFLLQHGPGLLPE